MSQGEAKPPQPLGIWSWPAVLSFVGTFAAGSATMAAYHGLTSPRLPEIRGEVSRDGGFLDGGHADGGHVDGGHADGGHVDGGHVDGGHADGGHADGGHVDGGHADGGHGDGGLPDGGPPDVILVQLAALQDDLTKLTQALAQQRAAIQSQVAIINVAAGAPKVAQPDGLPAQLQKDLTQLRSLQRELVDAKAAQYVLSDADKKALAEYPNTAARLNGLIAILNARIDPKTAVLIRQSAENDFQATKELTSTDFGRLCDTIDKAQAEVTKLEKYVSQLVETLSRLTADRQKIITKLALQGEAFTKFDNQLAMNQNKTSAITAQSKILEHIKSTDNFYAGIDKVINSLQTNLNTLRDTVKRERSVGRP